VTLDLTNPAHPPERKPIPKAGRSNKMIRWINPVLLDKGEEEKRKKKKVRRRQSRMYRLGSQGLEDIEYPEGDSEDEDDMYDSEEEDLDSDIGEREDMESEQESEESPDEGNLEDAGFRLDPEDRETDDSGKEDVGSKSNKIQIMELHSEKPMVMFRGKYYDCQWATNIGTEMLFMKHDQNDPNPLPILRNLEGDVDLLAASSQRIMCTEVFLTPKDQKPKKKIKRTRLKVKDLAIPVGRGAGQERKENAKFLEELINTKLEMGELDAVTVDARGRKSIWKWNESIKAKNRDEMKKLKKIIRKGGNGAAEAATRLAEIEEDEKRRDGDVDLRHRLGGPGRLAEKKKGVPGGPPPKGKRGRPVKGKLRMVTPEASTPGTLGTPGSGMGSMATSSPGNSDSEDEGDEELDDEDSEGLDSEDGDSEEDGEDGDSDEKDSEDDSDDDDTEQGDSKEEDSNEEDSEGDESNEEGFSDEEGFGSSDEDGFSDEDKDGDTSQRFSVPASSHGEDDTSHATDEDTTMLG
jgi:hypothetical protein